tara:strand:+ start:49 stop:246 length:198 start_codon:yes stop_codon:yes gene_type:complete
MTPKEEAKQMYCRLKKKMDLNQWFFKKRTIKRSCNNEIDCAIYGTGVSKEREDHLEQVRKEINLL